MSLECSECERDLRGGHDPSCSRSKGWIKCGLPWTYYGDWKNMPEPPSLSKEEKKEFGTTTVQAYRELEKFYKGCKQPGEYDKVTKTKEFKAAQRKYKKFANKVQEWRKNHPLYLEYQEDIAAYDKEISLKSFCGQKLNKPGTLLEIKIGKELKQCLIGDINILGGVCDDCMGFGKDAIVVRYKVLHGRV